MRRASQVDGNQDEIVDGLRRVGASVTVLSSVGNGITDIVVGFRGFNYLIEIKDPSQPVNKRKLTPAQEKWHAAWRGQREVVETLEHAFRVIGAEVRP